MAELVNVSCSQLLMELFAAVRRKDKDEILKILQDSNIDLSRTIIDDDGDALLHSAFKYASNRSTEILEIFLDRGVDIDAKNRSGRTLFHLACEERQSSVIDLCIRRKADLNVRDNRDDTAAHLVIENEKLGISSRSTMDHEDQNSYDRNSRFIDWMVSRGVDFFCARNRRGLSALYLSNEYKLYHILLTLLKRVTDLPSVEKDQTPLLSSFFGVYSTRASIRSDYYDHYAPRIVEIILEKSELISDATLSSCLRAAITGPGYEFSVIDMLLQRAQTNIDLHKTARSKSLLASLFDERLEDYQEQTIAQILFMRNPSIQMLQLFRDFKVDFNVRDRYGRSFLHLISKYLNNAEAIELVMNCCCDVDRNVTDSAGETPLHVALDYRKNNIIKALIKYGAKLEVKNRYGQTPLHLALMASDAVELLLEAGADVNAKDKMGKTPLHYVGEPAVIKVLFNLGARVDNLDVNGYSPLYDLFLRCVPQEESVFSEMLKYGADVQDSKIFKFLHMNVEDVDSCGTKKWLYLKQHFIKLIAMDVHCRLPVATDDLMDSNKSFFEGCQKEVESLKNYFINDSTSLYCLLHKNRNRRCAYLNNEKLENLVRDAAIKKKFPNYHVIIFGCYNEALRRKPLLESATHIIKEVIGIFLPDLCIDQILMFMRNCELLHLIELNT